MTPVTRRRSHIGHIPALTPPARSHIETLDVAGQAVVATVSFDGGGRPREIFLSGGKQGSMLDAMLADAAVVVSVALQYGVPAAALAKSVGRVPAGPVAPSDLDQPQTEKLPASPIGAALDLVSSLENGPARMQENVNYLAMKTARNSPATDVR